MEVEANLFRKETTLATEPYSNREGSGRRARRDRGSFQVSERDQQLLGLIAEQYAVTLDQLARLIGRTHRTARGLRDRWCNAGWTRSAQARRQPAALRLAPPAAAAALAQSPVPDMGAQPRPRQPHRSRHQRPPPPRTRPSSRGLGNANAQSRRALPPPPRSEVREHLPDAVLVGEQRIAIRGRAHPQEPRPPRRDRPRTRRELRTGPGTSPHRGSAADAPKRSPRSPAGRT